MMEELIKTLAAAAPGSLAGIVMLVICFKHLAGERQAAADMRKEDNVERARLQQECHAHHLEIAKELRETVQQNTKAVLRCAEMHGAVTQVLKSQQQSSQPTATQ